MAGPQLLSHPDDLTYYLWRRSDRERGLGVLGLTRELTEVSMSEAETVFSGASGLTPAQVERALVAAGGTITLPAKTCPPEAARRLRAAVEAL